MGKRIYLSPPHMGGEEWEFVRDAFESNWIAPLGPHVDAFEREVAEYVGVSHALALSSGTAGLHLALLVLGVEAGDIVLCSDLTFAASAFAVRYIGAEPVFIDADERTWNIDVNLLEDTVKRFIRNNRKPKAMIVVDLYGQCSDWEHIQEISERYGIPVIEDAAEALGSEYRGKKAGSFGTLGVLSFNGNKIITTSGGGMLLSNDRGLIDHARKLSTQAREPVPYYEHREIGYNYRMSNILAALGRGQLRVLDERVERKRWIFEMYRKLLGDLPGIDFMPEAKGCRINRWLTCVCIEPEVFGATREEVRLALEEENIEARPVWKPMHLQPVFCGCEHVGGDVSERLFEKGLCLPSGTALTDADIERIVGIIRQCSRT